MVDGPESLSPLDEQAGGITRRQALKRGALLGGALAWATPVVQVIGMRPAFAQTVSPACQVEVGLSGGGQTVACLTFEQSVCDCIALCGADDVCVALCLVGQTPISVVPGPC